MEVSRLGSEARSWSIPLGTGTPDNGFDGFSPRTACRLFHQLMVQIHTGNQFQLYSICESFRLSN